MGLVAEDHAIDVAVEAICILDKPRVGLDGDRRHQRRLGSAEHGVLEAVRVALLFEVALELVDQETAMGKDQNAGDLGGIDKGSSGDGLAGGGRVLEAVAANGAGVVDGLFARCVIVVVVVIVVRLVDASERHARNRTVDDPWQFDGCVVFVVVLETKLCVVIVVVVARIADNGAALVGQLRRIVLGLVELVLLGALRALEVANHGGEHAGEGVDLMGTKGEARL